MKLKSDDSRAHYELEKELAARLRTADRESRRALYGAVYDELFRRIPDHSQLHRRSSPELSEKVVRSQIELLGRFLFPSTTFMELGAGDCALSIEVAKRVATVYAVDVSREIVSEARVPGNMHIVISSGCDIPVPAGTVTLAYSNQLMEHLHEDDAAEQLANVVQALDPRGRYVCATPNSLTGPHDISRDFDDHATGFHLKEYRRGELEALFRAAGFSSVTAYVGKRGVAYVQVPMRALLALEWVLLRLPMTIRKRVARTRVMRRILDAVVVADK